MLNCLVFIGNINCISVGHNLYFYGQKSGTALSLTWVCLPVLDLEILLSNKLYVVVELISLVFYLSEIIALHYLISSVLKTVGLIYFVCFAVVASGGSGDGGSCICAKGSKPEKRHWSGLLACSFFRINWESVQRQINKSPV